jgi:uncharacterized phage-like protein YoqJ
MSKICCFTGHRDIEKISPSVLFERLEKNIIDLIENEGVTDFRAGGARGFDSMAALVVLTLKEKYPHIKLHLILPCKNQDKGFKLVEKQVYKYNLVHADSVFYVSEKYYAGVMLDRNRKLVDGADVCVAFMNRLTGGTYYTVNYARKNKLDVRNLMRI